MNFLTVFVRPPGDLVYFVLVVVVLMACLLMTVGQAVRRNTQSASRLAAGLTFSFGAWMLILLAVVFALLRGEEFHLNSLQALERSVQVWIVVALGLALSPAADSSLEVNLRRGAFGIAVTTLIFYLTTGGAVSEGLSGGSGVAALIWCLLPAAAGGVFIAGVLVQGGRSADGPLKLVLYSVLIAGAIIGLLQSSLGSDDGSIGALRLAFIGAMAVMAVIAYRTLLSGVLEQLRGLEDQVQRASTQVSTSERQPPPVVVRAPTAGERESTQLLRALGLMIEDTHPSAVPGQVVRAALEMLRADIGALIRVQDANYADLVVVMDRARKKSEQGLAVSLAAQPTLKNAIERLQQRPLFPDRNQAELDDLYTRLGLDQTSGPAYFQPLTREGELQGVLMVGFPFADRELSESESEALKGLGVIAAGLLALSDMAEEQRLLAEERAIQAMAQGIPLSQISDDQVYAARKSALAELQKSRLDIDALSTQVKRLEERLAIERDRLAMSLSDSDADLSISQRIQSIGQERAALREERDQLAERLRQMESALSGAGEHGDETALRQLIDSLREERDNLAAQRERLQAQLDDLMAAAPSGPAVAAQVVSEMDADVQRLVEERNQLKSRFELLAKQLESFGLDASPSGIAQLISELYAERTSLMARITTVTAEKDTIAQDRVRLAQRLAQLRESDNSIKRLEREVQNVLADRETVVRQRDAYKRQRDELVERFEAVRKFRERVVERVTLLEAQLKQLQQRYTQLLAAGGKSAQQGEADPITIELSRATARIADLENELSTLRSRPAPHEGGKPALETESVMGLVQDLRTPITSMRGYVDLMLRESVGILGDMQRRFLQRVAANVTRLSNMIEDLIRMAALDSGNFTLEREHVDLVGIVEDAISEVSVPLREKGIEVNLDLAVDEAIVSADREAMKQVVLQLLTNAYLAAPESSVVEITIDLERQAGRRWVHLAVTDAGAGIAPEDLPRVFGRRYQSENPLLAGLGDTGIGLAIAKQIVEAHDGTIDVESSVGGPTRFNVRLEFMPQARN